MEATDRKRRNILKGLAWCLGGLLLWRYLVPGTAAQKRPLLQVRKSEVPPRGALVYRESRVAILRNEERIYALDLSCTHLGCIVSVTPKELVCPCHGSVFDRKGGVVRGPAERPLQQLDVIEQGETLTVLV